jgi:hypothetical protein
MVAGLELERRLLGFSVHQHAALLDQPLEAIT